MKEMDTRVQYTKSVLQKALLRILERKPIAKVSIKEICEEAHINRGTFYLHYSEPNDLLKEIEDNFIEENLALFSPYFQENYETDQLAGMFTCILNNQHICRILMGRNGNPLFLERIQNMFRDNVIDRWHQEFPHYNKADLNYVFDFIFAGAMRLILNWIDAHNLPPQELARRLDRLGHYCHLAIQEFH